MFTTETTCTNLLTPQDGNVADVLAELIGSASSAVRFIIYGATHPKFFDALAAAHGRGVDVRGIFDHTQACGPKEAAQLHRLFLAVPAERFRIGTSEVGHQIVHLKGCWINYAGPADAQKVAGQFGTWQEAAAGCCPVTWSGSWNYSESASAQVNNLDIMLGICRAQAFQAAFDALWSFIEQHEQGYQRAS